MTRCVSRCDTTAATGGPSGVGWCAAGSAALNPNYFPHHNTIARSHQRATNGGVHDEQ
jgi:hypothetical protein